MERLKRTRFFGLPSKAAAGGGGGGGRSGDAGGGAGAAVSIGAGGGSSSPKNITKKKNRSRHDLHLHGILRYPRLKRGLAPVAPLIVSSSNSSLLREAFGPSVGSAFTRCVVCTPCLWHRTDRHAFQWVLTPPAVFTACVRQEAESQEV